MVDLQPERGSKPRRRTRGHARLRNTEFQQKISCGEPTGQRLADNCKIVAPVFERVGELQKQPDLRVAGFTSLLRDLTYNSNNPMQPNGSLSQVYVKACRRVK